MRHWLPSGCFASQPGFDQSPSHPVVQTGCNPTVMRGSSWHTGPRYSELSNRSSVPSDYRMYHLGFRLIREDVAEKAP